MFNFKLQSLLDYRRHSEGKIASQFADVKRQFNYEEDILKKLEKERSIFVYRLNTMENSKLCAVDISTYFLYIENIKLKKKYHKEIISEIATKLEKRRLELIDAIKKRKILEMLREKMLEEYRIDLISKERKELDELGTSRYARNMKIEKVDNCL